MSDNGRRIFANSTRKSAGSDRTYFKDIE